MARIYTKIHAPVMTAGNLDNDFILLTDSQDIREIESYFGKVLKRRKFRSFFVKVGDGDYDAVYGCHYFIPHNDDLVYQVEMIHDMSS